MLTHRLAPMATLTAAAALAACSRPPADDPRMVSEWMHALYGVVRTERLSPPIASRFMAYAAVGLSEGLAAADTRLPSAAGKLNRLAGLPKGDAAQRYDGTVTALAAEGVVLDSMLAEALPATRATLAGVADSLRGTRTALGVTGETAARSAELGRRVGLAVVAWSRTDGFDSTRGRPYTPPVGDAFWLNDTPASNYTSQNLSGATEPYWGQVRPFALKTWNECPIAEPPPYATDTASVRWRDAKHVYDVNQSLTPEQRAIALYWADNAGETGTPSGHWVSIASRMVVPQRLTAGEAAQLFVATAVAQADAFIAAWGYKYQFSTIRPRTYIRRLIDPAWEPLIPTPPFPEYPAGHSTQSVAAAAAIIAMLGDLPFEDSTGIAIGPGVRKFPSFSAAAIEAGESRIYGGIQFETGNAAGRAVGGCIGRKTAERLGVARRQ